MNAKELELIQLSATIAAGIAADPNGIKNPNYIADRALEIADALITKVKNRQIFVKGEYPGQE